MQEKKIIKVKNFKQIRDYHEQISKSKNSETVSHRNDQHPTPNNTNTNTNQIPSVLTEKKSVPPNKKPPVPPLKQPIENSKNSKPMPKKLPPQKFLQGEIKKNNEPNLNKSEPKKIPQKRIEQLFAPKKAIKNQTPIKKSDPELQKNISGLLQNTNTSNKKEPIHITKLDPHLQKNLLNVLDGNNKSKPVTINSLDPNHAKTLGLFAPKSNEDDHTTPFQLIIENHFNTEFVVAVEYKSCNFFKIKLNLEFEPSFYIFENMSENNKMDLLKAEVNIIDINGELYFVDFMDQDFYKLKNHDIKENQEIYNELQLYCGESVLFIDENVILEKVNQLVTDHISRVIEEFDIQLKDLMQHQGQNNARY